MKDMFFPMLPKLKEDSAVTPDKAAIWENERFDFINKIVRSLAVSSTIKDIGHIDSVPDVWARPLLFELALYDEQKITSQQFVKGLHEKVRGEWRCLLAMLALKNIKRLDIKVETVVLGKGDSDLDRTLTMLAPKDSISPDINWETIYIFSVQDVPIAMTSPVTLVATAADYTTLLAGKISEPWSSDGKTLTDPLFWLTGGDLTVLYDWLSKLLESLKNEIPQSKQENSAACQKLFAAIDEYRADIKASYADLVAGETIFTQAGFNITEGILRFLDKTAEEKLATAEDSAVLLRNSSKRQQAKKLLIISPEMGRKYAAVLGISPSRLLVWQGISANDISEKSLSSGYMKIGGVQLSEVEFRRPEEFFTDSLVAISPGNALKNIISIPGAELLAENDECFVPPIKAELLEHFTAQEIASRMKMEKTGNGIKVSFTFPLNGPDGLGSEYKYSKIYTDWISVQSNVPVVEIWPKLRRAGWNKYYMFYENTAAQAEENDVLGTNYFYIKPWSNQHEYKDNVPEKGLKNRYIAKLNAYPEALSCTVNYCRNGYGMAELIEGGMILLAEPPFVRGQCDTEWKIGIDFGTSSTMLYYRKNNQRPKPLVLNPNLMQITESGSARTRTDLYFIPSYNSNTSGSFLSIFHLLNHENQKHISPLEDGHIFMLNTQNVENFLGQSDHIDTNIKWREDVAGRRKVGAYIKQICLQSIAEATVQGVEKIQWNFSFPASFSKEQKDSFNTACQQAVQEAYEDTGLSAPEKPIEAWAESKAAAYYFNKVNNQDTNFSDGAICLDIGAGTTDISIISGQPGKIIYHTSIRFAGRYLFSPINHYLKEEMEINLCGTESDDEKQQAIIDADLREHSEKYLQELKNETGKDSIRVVLQKAQLGVAGIFYYIGGILAELKKRGMYQEKHLPDVYVGGNGSRIFNWLTGGVYLPDSSFLSVLKEAMEKNSNLKTKPNFKIVLSQKPKIEVASGMIEVRPQNDAAFFDENEFYWQLFGEEQDDYQRESVYSGELFVLNDRDKAKNTFLTAMDISDGVKIRNTFELERFLDIFNGNRNIWFDNIDVTKELFEEIKALVNAYYVSQKGKDAKQIFTEPVFIIELKKLMEMIADE